MLKICGMMNILFWVKPHDGAFPKKRDLGGGDKVNSSMIEHLSTCRANL